MIPENNKLVIKQIKQLLGNIDWRLIGSMNLVLQGCDLLAGDIDIAINVNDVDKVNEIFKPFCLKPIEWSEAEFISSYYGQFKIGGINVDVIARDPSGDKAVQVMLQPANIILVDGVEIPCASLETELAVYQKMGRLEKVEIIKKTLKNR